LHQYFLDSARRSPLAVAVVEPGHGSLTYGELDALSDRVRDRLAALGVRRGDRVGIYMRKSIDTLAAIYGILKAGAAYVPVDPGAPAARGAYIMHNCDVKVVVIEAACEARFRVELEQLGAGPQAANLDIERRARNKRIFATPICYGRKVDFAGVHRPDRNDRIVRRDDFNRGVQNEPHARQGVREAANERGGRQRFCVGGVVGARASRFKPCDVGEIGYFPRRFEVR